MLPRHQVELLLVDPSAVEESSDASHHSAVGSALSETGLINVHVVSSGEDAFRFLDEESAPEINLIVVDQPSSQGGNQSLSEELAFLGELKGNSQFRSIPVVVLTNDHDETAALNALSHGACSFVCKPDTDEQLARLAELFASYWSQVVQLPKAQVCEGAELDIVSLSESEIAAAQPVEVLVVDDSEDDVLLLKEAFANSDLVRFVETVENGEEALNYLRNHQPYRNAARPALVLLDINMPKSSGFDVLAEMRKDEQLQQVPVVMFTTSQQESDILRAYSDGACSFIAKPLSFEQMREIARSFAMYWSLVADLPKTS